MNEENKQTPAAEQPSGIFEPKPLPLDRRPLSGTQKAIRVGIGLAAVVLVLAVWLMLRNPFMKPVNRYFKGLTSRDPQAMTDAFPSFIVNAPKKEETMSIGEMCAAMISAQDLTYGREIKASAELVKKTKVEQEYLDRIAAGIRTQYQTDVRITEGYWVQLSVTRKSSAGEKETTEYARIYKINGKWYLLDVPSETQ